MRIISKFQDYYDSAGLMYGVDTNLLYERKTEDVDYSLLSSSQQKELNNYIANLPKSSNWRNNFILERGVIGFCGKLYPVYKENNYKITNYFTNFNKFAKLHKDLPNSIFKIRNQKDVGKLRYFTTKAEAWCFELTEKNYTGIVAEDIFYTLNTPVFLKWEKEYKFLDNINEQVISTITINPNLKELDFQHYFDPLAAFQEVSMYVAALANKNENINYTVGDDKTIAESKGHSVKESFRQSAPTKKQKRKLNKERKQ